MIGRALGVGVRVVGRIAGQQMVPRTASAAPLKTAPAARTGANPVSESRGASEAGAPGAAQFGVAQAGNSVRRGIGGFIQPFRRVGGIVWLEVTGFFFLLFAVLFVFRLWQNWADLAKEPVQRDTVIAVAAVFAYLGISAFWRAGRRSKRS